jgi:hypothetical protein
MAIQAQPSIADATLEPTARATLIFVRMWAIAHVLHLLIANGNSLSTPWNVAVVALAIVVILRPGVGRLVAAMAVAQLVEYVVEMPFSPDHWALITLVNLALLITMLVSRSTSTQTLTKAFPAARMILLIAYGAAAVSKWNATFLDPVTSCANAIAKAVSFGLIGPLGDSHLLNYGVMLTEALVFLLLAIPRTRCWGVLLGLAFHLSLSASPLMVVGDFTATVFALFFLFLRPDVTVSVFDRIYTWSGRSGIVRDARRRPDVTGLLAFLVLGFGGYAIGSAAGATMYVLEQFYFVSILAATALVLRERHSVSPIGRVRLVHLPVLALAVLWALNPYLGLRTTGSFTMFSNLRTESPSPNHVFMPTLHVTDWQDDMVTLTSSNDAQLQAGARNDLALPLHALRRMAMDDQDLQVTGVLHGRTVTWGNGEGQTRLSPIPYWQYKVFLFRPVTTDGRPFCSAS